MPLSRAPPVGGRRDAPDRDASDRDASDRDASDRDASDRDASDRGGGARGGDPRDGGGARSVNRPADRGRRAPRQRRPGDVAPTPMRRHACQGLAAMNG
ncbi:hypothetical protein ACFZA4_30855 [Streptomyces antimycoticus]|uniref:hypothetical protein n=1 Tax=Streptomyces antimycoticus TaxID=68175 RepID=UPI0036ED9DC5